MRKGVEGAAAMVMVKPPHNNRTAQASGIGKAAGACIPARLRQTRYARARRGVRVRLGRGQARRERVGVLGRGVLGWRPASGMRGQAAGGGGRGLAEWRILCQVLWLRMPAAYCI